MSNPVPLSEAEWLVCHEPERMLQQPCTAISPRKSRLFGCACVRRLWPLLVHKRLRRAVELAERYADGEATDRNLRAGRRLIQTLRKKLEVGCRRRWAAGLTEAAWGTFIELSAARAVEAVLQEEPSLDVVRQTRAARAAARAVEALREERLDEAAPPAGEPGGLETLEAADLVRCLVGNPFRLVAVEPTWLAWNGGTLRKMAIAIYDEHRFRDLPVLADALEEAGCASADILGHCRQPTEHVRGCWVIDALLGLK